MQAELVLHCIKFHKNNKSQLTFGFHSKKAHFLWDIKRNVAFMFCTKERRWRWELGATGGEFTSHLYICTSWKRLESPSIWTRPTGQIRAPLSRDISKRGANRMKRGVSGTERNLSSSSPVMDGLKRPWELKRLEGGDVGTQGPSDAAVVVPRDASF